MELLFTYKKYSYIPIIDMNNMPFIIMDKKTRHCFVCTSKHANKTMPFLDKSLNALSVWLN